MVASDAGAGTQAGGEASTGGGGGVVSRAVAFWRKLLKFLRSLFKDKAGLFGEFCRVYLAKLPFFFQDGGAADQLGHRCSRPWLCKWPCRLGHCTWQ